MRSASLTLLSMCVIGIGCVLGRSFALPIAARGTSQGGVVDEMLQVPLPPIWMPQSFQTLFLITLCGSRLLFQWRDTTKGCDRSFARQLRYRQRELTNTM